MASNQTRRFTQEDFAEIRRLKYDLDWPQKKIARHYQVSDTLISKVLAYGYDEYYRPRATGRVTAKLTPNDVIKMRELRLTGLSYVQIATRFGVNDCTVRDAVIGRNWADVPGALREVA